MECIVIIVIDKLFIVIVILIGIIVIMVLIDFTSGHKRDYHILTLDTFLY